MRALRAAVPLAVVSCVSAFLGSPILANCTDTTLPVFQCGFVGWFSPPPSGSGPVTAVWWQLGYGNNLTNSGALSVAGQEGTGIAPAGVFSGNDSGLFPVTMTDAHDVLPQYPGIPQGALCSNFENSWAGYQVDGCADNPRAGGADDDNLLNPYWGGTYGPGNSPPQYTLNYQIDYPMGMLLHESTGRFFAVAFVASKRRTPPRGTDISENFFDLGEVANGDTNPVHGRPNVIPWQPVPRPHVDGFTSGAGTVTLDLSWDSIRLVHDGSVRPSPRVVAGGVGVLDQLARPGGLCRYQLQTAPVTISNPVPGTLDWVNAGPVIDCPVGAASSLPVTTTLTVPNNSAVRIRTFLGKRPRTASTLLADVRLGASGDLGYEATDCVADDCLTSPPLLIVGDVPENQAPLVDAGPDQSIVLEDGATLNGTVTDDGLPLPATLVTIWSRLSGPGTVTFGDATAVDTTATFSSNGAYVLRLTATDGDLTTTDDVQIIVGQNLAPIVDAGSNQTINLPLPATLDGTVSDDGLPAGSSIVTTWSMQSGTGLVQFANASAVDTTATFSSAGTYVLKLTASDGALSASDTVTIMVNAAQVNLPPSVYAGPDQSIVLPAQVVLDGTVGDDGLPFPASLITQWSVDSGPASVTFANPGFVDTTASFSTAGTYVLRLTAFDGLLSGSDALTVQVSSSVANQPPSVNAGPDIAVVLPTAGTLHGSLMDDGLPSGYRVSIWSMDSGPAPVAFSNPLAAETLAVFPKAGTYVLRLVGTDGAASVSDTATVVAVSPGSGSPLEKRVQGTSDDAEERSDGGVTSTSAELDLGTDGYPQVVGVRFADLPIPPGATVVRAWVQFTAAKGHQEQTSLTLRGQASDTALVFTEAARSLSTRPTTLAAVAWDVVPWVAPGDAGEAQKSPDISPLIQEVINRPGWVSGGAIALIVTGSGHRAARSFDAGAAGAPLLHVELAQAPVNQSPIVDAGLDQEIRLPAGAELHGAASDDGLPYPPGALTIEGWSQVQGPASALIAAPQSLSTAVTFSTAGTYVFELAATDGAFRTIDHVTIVVNAAAPALVTLDLGIATANDDAEEKSGGTMYLDSSDLELVQDTTTQTVGLRFAGVTVPAGAVIRAAWVQFQTDEVNSEATNLIIRGEASPAPAPFTAVKGSISARARTLASVPWLPPAWTREGEAGLAQRTPGLASIVQELVNQTGWASGQPMVFIVTGSGHRTAEAFESGASIAPRLHIEYE